MWSRWGSPFGPSCRIDFIDRSGLGGGVPSIDRLTDRPTGRSPITGCVDLMMTPAHTRHPQPQAIWRST